MVGFPKNSTFKLGKIVDSEMDADSESFKSNKNQGNLESFPKSQCNGSQADWEDQIHL